MTDATFHPGHPFQGACFEECADRDKRCHDCYRINGKYTNFKPIKKRGKKWN